MNATRYFAFALAFSLFMIVGLQSFQPHRGRKADNRILIESAEDDDSRKAFSQDWVKSVGALLLTLVVGSAASSAGVGGGAFFVPLFNFLLEFSVKGATSLSQATITGGSIAAIALSLQKPHPVDPAKPLIDYDLGLLLLPALLLGVSLGVLANKVFPAWLITLQLVTLLLYLTHLAVRKAIKLHRAEVSANCRRLTVETHDSALCQAIDCTCAPRSTDPSEAGQRSPVHAGDTVRSCELVLNVSDRTGSTFCVESSEACSPASDESSPGAPRQEAPLCQRTWVKVVQMLALWAVFLVLQALKSRWGWCSVPFFIIYAIQCAFCISTGGLFLWQAEKVHAREAEERMRQPILEDIYPPASWTRARLLRTSVVTLVAGTVAGLLGIGGGMIIGPLLLELGVHPLVSAATSSLMVLFSASSATLSLAVDGVLNLQFALIFGLGCLAASLLGVLGISRLVRKSGKASIIVMLLAGIIGTGALLTIVLGGRSAVSDLSMGHNVGFSSFCSPS